MKTSHLRLPGIGLLTVLLSCGHAHDLAPAASVAQATVEPEGPARTQQPVSKEPEKTPEPRADDMAEPPTAGYSEEEPPPIAADSIESFMLEHFVISAWARDSVVHGNLESLRKPLFELAEYRYDSVAPGGWMKGIAQLQAAARLTAQAQTLTAAANGVAAMGRVCGDCHAQYGGPDVQHYPVDKTRPKSDRLDGRMFRHAWAVERLWEGLTAPSDNAWQAGAAALVHAPSVAPQTRPSLPPAIIETLSLVRRLGEKASNAENSTARERVYGELLVTCAQCHRSSPAVEF